MTFKSRMYALGGPRVQAAFDRARYALKVLPRLADDLDAADAFRDWPEPHRACFVVSADLELAWAWRYAKGPADPKAWALALARRSRENLPPLLDLFARHDQPVTWATVGHLFLESCNGGARAHDDVPRPPHFENDLWRFDSGDWFDDDPRSDADSAPAWYGPDMVDAIVAADPRHEIGCHTFSHVDFSDENCPPSVAGAEVEATVAAARVRGIEVDTMVFPGNRAGNYAALADAGFRAYRHHGRAHLDVPRRDGRGLWRIPGGLCWERPPGWRTGPWIDVLRRAVDRAVDTGTLLHLWFHPSCEPGDVHEVFPAVLDHVASKGTAVWRATMRDVAVHSAGSGGVTDAVG